MVPARMSRSDPGVDVGADALGRFRRREHPDGRAALAPLPRALLELGEALGVRRALQRAVAHGIAVDRVFFDRLPDHGRRAAEQGQRPFAIVRAQAPSGTRAA